MTEKTITPQVLDSHFCERCGDPVNDYDFVCDDCGIYLFTIDDQHWVQDEDLPPLEE